MASLQEKKRARDEEDLDLGESPAKKARTEMLIDDGESQVPYEPAFFNKEEADGFFESLMQETEWQTETIKRWNKEIITPRRVYAFSDPNVKYKYIGLSRVGAPWTPTMTEIKTRVEAYCGVPFNFCFVNLYRNGQDTIGYVSVILYCCRFLFF
jgi:alkylated DNA repair dioxygenase AlkB